MAKKDSGIHSAELDRLLSLVSKPNYIYDTDFKLSIEDPPDETGGMDAYIFNSHACDIRDKVIPVPRKLEGRDPCVYVTLATCGRYQKVNDVLERLQLLIQHNHKWIRNPIKYQKHIIEYINRNNIRKRDPVVPIHIHYAGAPNATGTYVNSCYSALHDWACDEYMNIDAKEKTHLMFQKCGLYKSGTPFFTPVLSSGWESLKKSLICPINEISIPFVRELFEGSELPTADEVIDKIMDELPVHVDKKNPIIDRNLLKSAVGKALSERLLSTKFRYINTRGYSPDDVTQLELFQYKHGIYYNLACRGDCEKGDVGDEGNPSSEFHDLRRQASEEAHANLIAPEQDPDCVPLPDGLRPRTYADSDDEQYPARVGCSVSGGKKRKSMKRKSMKPKQKPSTFSYSDIEGGVKTKSKTKSKTKPKTKSKKLKNNMLH